MKWYLEKIKSLGNITPIISVCGDDCAVCPRFLAGTEEELHETAIFWHRVGWRDTVVSNDSIKCTGCGCRPTCSYMILPCQKEKEVESCRQCGKNNCDKINKMLENTEIKEYQCKEACENEEIFALLKRAFYEKKKNLNL